MWQRQEENGRQHWRLFNECDWNRPADTGICASDEVASAGQAEMEFHDRLPDECTAIDRRPLRSVVV